MNRPDGAPVRASLLVVTHNNAGDIADCLRSVRPTLGPRDELILVDNASTDGTVEYLRAAFPDLQVLQAVDNRGFGAGNNLGAARARGEFLVFLNPDTTVEPGWLDALVGALETHPEAGLATARILLRDDPGRINTCGNEMHLSGLTLCRGLGEPKEAYPAADAVGAVSGAAFAMRREAYEALGGFDEAFFMYMEDTDLSLRARLAGWDIRYVPDSIVYHDYRLTFGPRKTYYQERNRYRLLLKTFRWRTLLALLLALLLAEIVTWGFVFVRERRNFGNKLRAYAAVLREWPETMAARREVQARRAVPDRAVLAGMTHRLDYGQTGRGAVAALAHGVFDPLFWGLRIWVLGWNRLLCA